MSDDTHTALAGILLNLAPTHRHYKGGFYCKLFDATHSETEELMTVYLTADGRPFVRPKAMFDDTLPDGQRRFAPLG